MVNHLFSKAFVLADLLDYQDSSIVSRTVIDNKAGTVTLFAFDSDQKLSEHTAPYDALVELIQGEAEITINGDPNILTAGKMIVLPANLPHSVRATKPFKMLLTMIRSKEKEEK
jgi:quercetin dioxygenase-like cupin family protein